MKHWIGNGGVICFKRFKNQPKSYGVSVSAVISCFIKQQLLSAPVSYVATNVANAATFWREEYSSMRESSSVRTNKESRSEQNLDADGSAFPKAGRARKTCLRGFRSMNVISLRCCRKDRGVSATTCKTRIRVYVPIRSVACFSTGIMTNLQVFDETSQEGSKMLRPSNVTWHSFMKNIGRKDYTDGLGLSRGHNSIDGCAYQDWP